MLGYSSSPFNQVSSSMFVGINIQNTILKDIFNSINAKSGKILAKSYLKAYCKEPDYLQDDWNLLLSILNENINTMIIRSSISYNPGRNKKNCIFKEYVRSSFVTDIFSFFFKFLNHAQR